MGSDAYSLVRAIASGLFGRSDSVSRSEVEGLAARDRISKYLPWLGYNREDQRFLLADNTLAYMWEVSPLVYQGPKQTAALEGVLQQPFPDGTIMQYVLFPDSDIDQILEQYRSSKTRLDEVGKHAIDKTCEFFQEGAKGLKNIRGVPIRNFRCFIVLKSEEDLTDFIPTVEEMLESAGLQPGRMNDADLLGLADRVINNRKVSLREYTARAEEQVYTRDRPLRNKAVSRQTWMDFSGRYPKIAGRYAACLTPSDVPEKIDPLRTNNLFGGVMGVQDDGAQLNFPFLYSCNIIYANEKEDLAAKVSLTMGQSAAGSFSHQLKQRVMECQRYRSDEAKGERYVKVLPSLWVFGDTTAALKKNIGRAKMVWGRADTGKFTLETESVLNQSLFIASLPGGLYNVGQNIANIDRHYYMSISACARFLPVQGDFAGNGRPVTLYLGRKGQVVGIDVFAPNSTNHNFLVCAESGGGKSFLLNTMLSDYYYAGEKVRIVDLGRSYEKLCRTNNGKFIDFTLDADDQCINPLDFVVKRGNNGEIDKKDLVANLRAAALVFSEMVYSKSKAIMAEHESQLIKDAVIWAYNNDKQIEGTDAIYDYLVRYAELTKGTVSFLDENVAVAKRMAYCIKDFTSHGPYGKFFVGKSDIKIAEDDFVVVELDDIKNDPELFGVVVLQMMNEITQDLYLSDRQHRRFILFEEAPSLLKDNGNTDLSRLAEMIDEGYRRARKYGGAFGLVMQSIMDTQMMGKAGKVALSNAAYKFMLSSKSNQYSAAADAKIIEYEGFALNLLNSLKNNKPRYSEVFIESPQARGVARLVVDPFRYLINTTESHEVAVFNRELKRGRSALEATLAIKEAA